MSTDLYKKTMAWARANQDDRGELMQKVWQETPWMVNAYTGGHHNDMEREYQISEWCRSQFGPEAWPLHGKPGNWHRGGATVNGWTWIGFATEAMMNAFVDAWPEPNEVTR